MVSGHGIHGDRPRENFIYEQISTGRAMGSPGENQLAM